MPSSASDRATRAISRRKPTRHSRAAEALYGYGPYLDRVPERAGQRRHGSDNREERARAVAALRDAAAGTRVAVVSGGDPGVFAMAAAVCEEIEAGPESWRALDLVIVPGITAMLAVAARIGAPLGHDFCALSLSDNLKPWELVEQRLDAAAGAGFVMALYNPVSRARPWQFGAAIERLRRHLPGATPVVFGRAVGRPDEHVSVTTLAVADTAEADMATLIIVGSRANARSPAHRTGAARLYAACGRRGERMIEPVERILHSFDGECCRRLRPAQHESRRYPIHAPQRSCRRWRCRRCSWRSRPRCDALSSAHGRPASLNGPRPVT